jgi:hypothetical protein
MLFRGFTNYLAGHFETSTMFINYKEVIISDLKLLWSVYDIKFCQIIIHVNVELVLMF